MRKPKPFDPDAPIAEEGEQDESQEEKDEQQKKFLWSPKHRAGYSKQERLA